MSSSPAQTKHKHNHNHNHSRPRRPRPNTPASVSSVSSSANNNKTRRGVVLILHGNRQTGQLLVGRLEKLRKRLRQEFQLELVAPDAPFTHPENENLRTWWHRQEGSDNYQGLDQSLTLLQQEVLEKEENVVGILGFSQGARLAHLVAMLHAHNPSNWFPNIQFLMFFSGYDAPMPPNFSPLLSTPPMVDNIEITVPSLHVWGLQDPLISPEQSQTVMKSYLAPQIYEHGGKHYVPTKAPDIQTYIDFVQQALVVEHETATTTTKDESDNLGMAPPSNSTEPNKQKNPLSKAAVKKIPDEEAASMQQEEVQALEAIFPEEVALKSKKRLVENDDYEVILEFPIVYHMKLVPSEDVDPTNTTTNNWAPRPLALQVQYPYNYPFEAIPEFRLLHENNSTEWPSSRVVNLLRILTETATMELGMPSVLSCIYAARDYLDAPPSSQEEANYSAPPEESGDYVEATVDTVETPLIQPSTTEAIQKCNTEGLEIAQQLLTSLALNNPSTTAASTSSNRKGGSFWTYTIGLVGKPSAGKSTFFNAATAFSRQRGDNEGDPEWGGASMAAHPFTTIDPNIGYCLIPAPPGSCPEDDLEEDGETSKRGSDFASTHGRDPEGRRFLPVLLKDVAGLVPGAYQGRGRGNQFLNDLTDATVLIHVVDASGTADAQGNKTITESDSSECTHPLDDLAWIRNELVEWVYSNLTAKWDAVLRKGRIKLSGMFSGYGQKEAVTQSILSALQLFLEDTHQRDRALENMDQWDQADVHRLVSAFLGVRFPMALALNKYDVPSSQKHVREIKDALPIHGAYAGTPLAASREMNFVRQHLADATVKVDGGETDIPAGVWKCLTSAVMLREPILVFPVSDMTTYMPLPGLNKDAAEHASLPSKGMIRCIQAAGGCAPTCWSAQQEGYILPTKERTVGSKLRDVILMKPGSTAEDVFLTLKKLGAIGGEFVRAEAASKIGEKPKPIPKHELMGKKNRIIKIMSNKRTAWQS